MPPGVAGAGPPSFPRLCEASGSPPITCMSILLLLCPDVHRSPLLFASVWQGEFCFPFSFGKHSAAGGGQLRPKQARAASLKSQCPRDRWLLAYFSFPCTCDIGDKRRGSSQGPGPTQPSGPNPPHISILDGGTDARRQLRCSSQELLCEETPAQS